MSTLPSVTVKEIRDFLEALGIRTSKIRNQLALHIIDKHLVQQYEGSVTLIPGSHTIEAVVVDIMTHNKKTLDNIKLPLLPRESIPLLEAIKNYLD